MTDKVTTGSDTIDALDTIDMAADTILAMADLLLAAGSSPVDLRHETLVSTAAVIGSECRSIIGAQAHVKRTVLQMPADCGTCVAPA